MDAANPVVELKQITKRFSGIVANDSISLKLHKGEILALLGENGAGKSTLMNILFGLYQPDEGSIEIKGKPVSIDNPNKAIELGIGMVHQHFKLVQPFTVTENIILGMEPKKLGFHLDYKTATAKIKSLSDQYGLKVDPNSKVSEISVGMQQRVEILKTLYRGADILIFDEPTAVLTPQEITDLMSIMRRLVDEGKSIILITHKLKEIMHISDAVTIIRRGKVVDTLKTSETDPNTLAEKMVGRNVSFKIDKKAATPGESILEVRDLMLKNKEGVSVLDGLSLDVRAGEILGVAGVDGNGQSELIEALTGLRKVDSGSVTMKGMELANRTPRFVSEQGVSHIPEDRHKHGLVLDFSMSENMVLETYYKAPFNKGGFLNQQEIDKQAKKLIEAFDVRTPSIETKARSLSGGNQQKAIIAREIDKKPELLIAAQPTRGLDVGAIEFVQQQLISQRDQGKAVMLISFELDEIMNVADRIVVIYEGRIVGEVLPEQTNDQELGLMMSGSTSGGKQHE
ncbi:ABC transporter ATP-binding protein [Paenibacillus macquariensis]|uniref:Simple sugar transport system ATP-binding protein n=1 Tax=Paenibacillus macquariensis TaxID=948756 RepID=A0ABY1JRZ9_9BACL|nr:ABC transporter ATP-binding protein [Paenibacillus macquariensis]MEC0092832.1 ABC transporter ATP-binding protein [Paenibacillus macquariensis]OAB36212.1 heme ABC transporter ATP-binding protein [Paenibacillus macquariensis subsp. macquariensis]SIQ67107.1 simple sugar transport system ATP-binding protein [Paenibacillus macquariensis]